MAPAQHSTTQHEYGSVLGSSKQGGQNGTWRMVQQGFGSVGLCIICKWQDSVAAGVGVV